jgi:hypothetical protein
MAVRQQGASRAAAEAIERALHTVKYMIAVVEGLLLGGLDLPGRQPGPLHKLFGFVRPPASAQL